MQSSSVEFQITTLPGLSLGSQTIKSVLSSQQSLTSPLNKSLLLPCSDDCQKCALFAGNYGIV